MVLLVLIALLAASCAHGYWNRLGDGTWQARYWTWFVQGLIFPAVIWSLVNIGFGDRFPALVPNIADAQNAKRAWLAIWFGWSAVGLIWIFMYWTAITYLWLFTRIAAQTDEPREFAITSAVIGALSLSVAAVCVYSSGWIYTGAGVCLAFLPVIHFTMDLAEKPPPRPTYDRAVGKLKRGNYSDAEWEVIAQLEKSENDFEGWMLLAELYATKYRKLEDAARVIFDICQQPETQPYQISIACDKLADWQLEIAANPLGARAALELLCRKLPGSHFARMAEQRLKRIPATVEEFDESKKPRAIRLPVLREEFENSASAARGSRQDAIAEANRLSDKLRSDPNDIAAREQLAGVLAEKLGKIETGASQLEMLIELDEPSEEQKAKWSARIANWRFAEDRDEQKFREALSHLIRSYPHTATAFGAQRRLNLMFERHALSGARSSLPA